MQSSSMLRSRAMPAAGTASTSRASRPSALVVRARTQVLEEGKAPKESRVGKVPIPVPSGTNVTLETAYIKVKVRTFDVKKAECETENKEKNKKMRERKRREEEKMWRGDCRFDFPLTTFPPSLPCKLFMDPQGPKGELELNYPDLVEIKKVRN